MVQHLHAASPSLRTALLHARFAGAKQYLHLIMAWQGGILDYIEATTHTSVSITLHGFIFPAARRSAIRLAPV